MLDVVVFVINKYKDGKTWRSHKATWQCAQHHSLYFLWESLARLLRLSWKSIVNLSHFSHLFLFKTSQHTSTGNSTSVSEILCSKLCTTQLCELCCSINSNWGYGMCTHKLEKALLEAARLQHGSGMQWLVGPGSIWVPSCSPWLHPDKKQTNQQNKHATEMDHMLELGKQ